MPTLYRTRDAAGQPHPCWKYRYLDWTGRKRAAKGYPSRDKTLREAREVEAYHRAVRDGRLPPPRPADAHRHAPAEDALAEYLALGARQGHARGAKRPWTPRHAQQVAAAIRLWHRALGVRVLDDLARCRADVDRVCADWSAEGVAPATVNYRLALFATWTRWLAAPERRKLAEDPLRNVARCAPDPRRRRRALDPGEIQALLAAAPPHRALLYETALATGFRAGELRALGREHLDPAAARIALPAAAAKNRKDALQPLAADLARRLDAHAASGAPARRYRLARRKRALPDQPLLYVQTDLAAVLARDLAAAGVALHAFGGVCDFHSLRVTYVTLLVESGATIAEAQKLARHANPALTANVYARVREQRLPGLAEALGTVLRPPSAARQSAG